MRHGNNQDNVFRREIGRDYPLAERAEGACIYDSEGRRYLDAAGSYFTLTIGHGVGAVVDAAVEQMRRLDFAHSSYFDSEAARRFAARLIALAPAGFTRVYFATSGSAANETALKLARQYHVLTGNPQKTRFIARWNSYHGGSIGALSLTGQPRRREPFEPYLLPFPHIDPPYCYRCPVGKRPESCATECADELEKAIRLVGAHYIAGFIVEPVSGGPLGALPSPDGYLPRVREICDRYGILMVVDEVITGAGRTGKPLGIDHANVTPDIISMAKGIAGGYVPVGATLVHQKVYGAFEEAGVSFRHGETFSGHPLVCAIGDAVLAHMETHGLVERAARIGDYLETRLAPLRARPIVGDIRGKGLLRGIEFVRDKASKAPFPRALQVAERVAEACIERGLLVVAGTGCADGVDGDTVALAPPLTLSEAEADEIAAKLGDAVGQVARVVEAS